MDCGSDLDKDGPRPDDSESDNDVFHDAHFPAEEEVVSLRLL
jgi:hypothetical protein